MGGFTFPYLVRGWLGLECLLLVAGIFTAIVSHLAKAKVLNVFNDINSPVKSESVAYCGLFCAYSIQCLLIKLIFFVDFYANPSVAALQRAPIQALNMLISIVGLLFSLFQIFETLFGTGDRPINGVLVNFASAVVSVIVYAIDNVRRQNLAVDEAEAKRKPRRLFAKHYLESQVPVFGESRDSIPLPSKKKQ